MSSVIYVALGGALGASGRYLFGQSATRWLGSGFPYATLGVNVIGSAAMGVLFGYLMSRGEGHDSLRLFFGVGVLGGFTTFSAFSLDAIMMLERKAYGAFAGYIGMSVIMSLMAMMLGLWAARSVLSS